MSTLRLATQDFTSDAMPPRWRHWIVPVEAIGRITLPAPARDLLGDRQTAQAVSRGWALVMKRGGTGAAVLVDRRGRVVLPTWLRHASSASNAVLLSAGRAKGAVIVVAPTTGLDAIVEQAVEEVLMDRQVRPASCSPRPRLWV